MSVYWQGSVWDSHRAFLIWISFILDLFLWIKKATRPGLSFQSPWINGTYGILRDAKYRSVVSSKDRKKKAEFLVHREAFEMWKPCQAIMMYSILKWWLQRMQALNWDAAYDAAQVYSTIKGVCLSTRKGNNKHVCCCISEFIPRNSFFLHQHSCVWRESKMYAQQENSFGYVSTVEPHFALIVCKVLQADSKKRLA